MIGSPLRSGFTTDQLIYSAKQILRPSEREGLGTASTRKKMKRWLHTGRSTMMVVAGWNLFDALLHVAADMVEPPRVGGNLAVLTATVVACLVASPRLAASVAALAGSALVGLNLAWVTNEGGIAVPALVFIATTLVLLGWAVRRFLQEASKAARNEAQPWYATPWIRRAMAVVAVVVVAAATFVGALGQAFERQLHNDELIAADYWSDELVILSAGLGFDNIIGVPDDDLETVRAAGGTYYAEPACVEPDRPLVSTVSPTQIDRGYRGFADYDDGLPVVISWPVLTSTVHPEDFLFTLNTGEQVVPHAAGMVPNWESNERNVLVVFGDFGNRGRADEPDAVFPVKLEIVDDGTPLTFLVQTANRAALV